MVLPVTVVIPTMNRPESLERTIRHFAEGTDGPSQIVVVDQSQSADIREQNRNVMALFEGIIPLQNYVYQQIPSLTKARNLGLAHVSNEIVIFADDDIDVHNDTVRNVHAIMSDTNIAMIAGIDELTSRSDTNIGYLLGTKSYRKRKIGHVTKSMLGRYPDDITSRVETQWAQGYFFVVRKSLLDKWKIRWDENLTSYAYAEDLDFSFSYYKRAKQEGLRCVLDPLVTVKHLATLEYRIPGSKSIFMYIVNRAYLSNKHNMGFSGMIASGWCNFWRLVQAIITRRNAREYFRAMRASCKFRAQILKGKLDYDLFMKG